MPAASRAASSPAVACDRGRLHTEIAQKVGHREVCDEHAEDGRTELAEFRFGRGPLLSPGICGEVQNAAKRFVRSARGVGKFVAPRERPLHLGEHAAQIREHVEVLRPLAGVEERDGALLGQWLGEPVDAAAVAELLRVRIGETLRGAVQFLDEIGG